MGTSFDIGVRLKELCTQQGISQERLAILADVTTTYYGEIERNLKNITVAKLEKICEVLQVTLREFFSAELPDKVDTSENRSEQALIRLIQDLPDGEQDAVLRILREITSYRNVDR